MKADAYWWRWAAIRRFSRAPSARLARVSAQGYSATVPVAEESKVPNVSLTDDAAKI